MNHKALILARGSMYLPHEAAPVGVPKDYDWYARPQLRAKRSDMGALTGWLHAFSMGGPSKLQMCGLKTYFRVGNTWTIAQDGVIDGGVFRPDFAGNTSSPAIRHESNGILTSKWREGVWHCWPRKRAVLPAGVDEIVVLAQVRAVGSPVLVGCGADYWRDTSIGFGDGTNNPGIGLGRLNIIHNEFEWVGFSSNP